MGGNQLGAFKVAAQRLGISLETYITHVDANEKWCYKCRQWKPRNRFHTDRTRSDGRKAICQECIHSSTHLGLPKEERQQQRLLGLSYCRRCRDWRPVQDVHEGLCKIHRRQEARERYAKNARYRSERRQHAHARKRRIRPIPSIGQEYLLEWFHGECAYCGKKATTWDHIYPVARGGTTTAGNIVPACVSCNSSKRDRNVFEWIQATKKSPHPAFADILILIECGLYSTSDLDELLYS